MESPRDNMDLGINLDQEEVKRVVLNVNRDSACGLHGLSRRFFQECWDITGNDIVRMVRDFFEGNSLPQ